MENLLKEDRQECEIEALPIYAVSSNQGMNSTASGKSRFTESKNFKGEMFKTLVYNDDVEKSNLFGKQSIFPMQSISTKDTIDMVVSELTAKLKNHSGATGNTETKETYISVKSNLGCKTIEKDEENSMSVYKLEIHDDEDETLSPPILRKLLNSLYSGMMSFREAVSIMGVQSSGLVHDEGQDEDRNKGNNDPYKEIECSEKFAKEGSGENFTEDHLSEEVPFEQDSSGEVIIEFRSPHDLSQTENSMMKLGAKYDHNLLNSHLQLVAALSSHMEGDLTSTHVSSVEKSFDSKSQETSNWAIEEAKRANNNKNSPTNKSQLSSEKELRMPNTITSTQSPLSPSTLNQADMSVEKESNSTMLPPRDAIVKGNKTEKDIVDIQICGRTGQVKIDTYDKTGAAHSSNIAIKDEPKALRFKQSDFTQGYAGEARLHHIRIDIRLTSGVNPFFRRELESKPILDEREGAKWTNKQSANGILACLDKIIRSTKEDIIKRKQIQSIP